MFIKAVHHRICDCCRPTKSVLHWHLNSFFSFLSHILWGFHSGQDFGSTIWRAEINQPLANQQSNLPASDRLTCMHARVNVCCACCDDVVAPVGTVVDNLLMTVANWSNRLTPLCPLAVTSQALSAFIACLYASCDDHHALVWLSSHSPLFLIQYPHIFHPFIHFFWLAHSFSLAPCLSFNLIHQFKHAFISHIVVHSRIELIDLIESFNFFTRHLECNLMCIDWWIHWSAWLLCLCRCSPSLAMQQSITHMCLIDLLILSFIDSLIRWFTHSFIHSFIHQSPVLVIQWLIAFLACLLAQLIDCEHVFINCSQCAQCTAFALV